MATCSDVTTCLSEGSTECTLASETCPPCVYALSGGDFSCYSRDSTGECPFSGAYEECDKASSSTPKKSSESSSSGDTTPASTTKAPASTTATPTKAPTTATPTKAPTTAPKTSTSGISSSTSSQASPDQNTPTTHATSSPSTSTTTSSSSDVTQASKTAASSSTDSSAEKALTSNSTATTGSPAMVNLALIGGAVVLVVIVIAFVARRVMKKKKMYATQENTVSSHNSAWSDRTLGTGGTSGGNLYSTYSYKDDGSKGTGMSIMSDSQASSAYGPGYHGQPMSSGSSPRSTADFSTNGDNSQFAENSQYYSVSTGPELLAAGAVAGAQHHYANNGVPPSNRTGNHFVDVTATSMNRDSEVDSTCSGQQPLTVSQLMPTAIEEDEEEAYATRRKPAQYQQSTRGGNYNLQTAVPPSSRKPQIFGVSGVSTASSIRSDYDIVDPITMRDVEARNTEMLAEDGRYPKFSFESEADIYDGSSSGEESDDDRVRHEEHTI